MEEVDGMCDSGFTNHLNDGGSETEQQLCEHRLLRALIEVVLGTRVTRTGLMLHVSSRWYRKNCHNSSGVGAT